MNLRRPSMALLTAVCAVITVQPAAGFDADKALGEIGRGLAPGRTVVVPPPGLVTQEQFLRALRLHEQAQHHHEAGDYTAAEPLYVQALEVLENTRDPGILVERTMNHLGAVYTATGEYARAERLYKRVMERWRWRYPRIPHLVNVLQRSSFLYIAKDSADTDLAESLTGLAALYTTTATYTKALSLLLQAQKVAEEAVGPDHPATAATLAGLGRLHLEMGALDKALPLFERALAIREQKLGPTHPDAGRSQIDLAMLHTARGKTAQAEALFERGLATLEAALGPAHPDLSAGLSWLATLRADAGDHVRAEALHRRALTIQLQAMGADHPDTATLLKRQALMHWRRGQTSQALTLLERAREVEASNVARLFRTATEERRLRYLSRLSPDMDVSFSLSDPAPGVQALGATAVLHSKGRVLDATSEMVALLRRDPDPMSRNLLAMYQRAVAQRAASTVDGVDPMSLPGRGEWLYYLDAEQEMVEEMIIERMGSKLQQIRPISLQQVQAALGPSDVLIEWTRFRPLDPRAQDEALRWGSPRFAAYLITRAQAPVAVDLGPADAIEQAVQALRNQLTQPASDPRSQEARTLHQLVMQPLLVPLQKLQPRPGQVLLSPDGALNLVPLAALVDGQGLLLDERFATSYLSSGRDLLRLQTDAPARGGVSVFANPDYEWLSAKELDRRGHPYRSPESEEWGLKFGPLSGTVGEARLLARLFNLAPEQLATGDEASEARLKNVTGPVILHVATHGFAMQQLPKVDAIRATSLSTDRQPRSQAKAGTGEAGRLRGVESDPVPAVAKRPEAHENPLLRSGLALASANHRIGENGEDGILTAAEAALLDLQGTQLVVLSACETGAGEVTNGEGVYGLRRALVLAGAQSQLVSLWKVSDAATEQLMGEYYRRLQQGEGRAEALRSAQAVIRANPATAHPYFWAPFIPVGDWRPLKPAPRPEGLPVKTAGP